MGASGNVVQQTNVFMEIVKIAVPAFVTIIGFVITYFLTRSDIKRETDKKKTNIYLNELSSLPLEIIDVIELLYRNSKDYSDKIYEIIDKILAYGAKDSIKIVASMQEDIHKLIDDPKAKTKTTYYMILLSCQLKYDMTGIQMSPDYFYRAKVYDYSKGREDVIKNNNDIVNELSLKKFLKIK